MMTIGKYWATVFEVDEVARDMTNEDGWDELDTDKWPIDSVCGVVAQRMIDKCAELLPVMREDEYKARVLRAVQNSILVVCFG